MSGDEKLSNLEKELERLADPYRQLVRLAPDIVQSSVIRRNLNSFERALSMVREEREKR